MKWMKWYIKEIGMNGGIFFFSNYETFFFDSVNLYLLGHMLRNLKKEILSKILYIQFIQKLKIKCNTHILINYPYIWYINFCLRDSR